MNLKKRRRIATVAGSVLVAAMLPSAVFQLVLYRQNLAVARESFPLSKPIQKQDRLLIISPHCDDETLGAGGTIAAARKSGSEVRVVFITNGDGSRSTQVLTGAQEFETKVVTMARPAYWRTLLASQRTPRANSKSRPSTPQRNLFERIAAMRQLEAVRACGVLGVPKEEVIFLGYPDGGTRNMWETNWSSQKPFYSAYTKTAQSPYDNSFTPCAKYSGAAVMGDIKKIIREFHPTVILTTHPEDTHPDHWSAYSYTNAAIESLRLSEDVSTRNMAISAKLRTFLIHHGVWPAPHGYNPNAELAPPASLHDSGTRWEQEPLSAKTRSTKNSALNCYVSQLAFTPHYLRSFVRKNELFGGTSPVKVNSQLAAFDPQLLVKDAPCDSLWRERWPAADIHSLKSQFSRSGVLALQINLGRSPSPRVRYRLVVHTINSQSTRAFQIEARPERGKLYATLHGLSTGMEATLNGVLTNRGFQIEIPLRTMRADAGATTLSVSANTHAGRARLDQTATATIRLN